MRISTAHAYDAGIDALTRRQGDLASLQEQLTTGKRVARASDDPASASRAERALANIDRATTGQRAVEASRVAMVQVESALGDAGGLMQRARELLVSAGNPTYSDAERRDVAAELKSLREQLFAVANRDDGAGTYLFGGRGSAQLPFLDAPGGVQFVGSGGPTITEAAAGLPLNTDGQATWLAARTGNGVFVTSAGAMVKNATIDNGSVSDPSQITGADYALQFTVSGGTTTYAVLKNGAATAVTAAPYVSGQPIEVDGMKFTVSGTPASGDSFAVAASTPTLGVFDALDRAVAALQTPGRTGSQIAQANADSLRDVDAVMTNLQGARASAGQILGRIDTDSDRLETQKLASTTERSNAEDVEMVHAFSEFQNHQTGYDAALKAYAMVQRLSLFQYVDGG